VKRDQNIDSYTGFLASLIEKKIIDQELTPLRRAEGLSKNLENEKEFYYKSVLSK
jgi:predicted alternative tryptophan synthase beta-subunit